MPPSLITSITSVLVAISFDSNLYKLKIGLMNLKAVLLCLRMLRINDDDDDDAMGWLRNMEAHVLCSSTLCDDVHQSGLFSRIGDALGNINVENVEDLRQLGRRSRRGPYDRLSMIADEVHMLAKEVDDELWNQSSSSSSSPLKVDKVAETVDSILDSVLEFLGFARYIVIGNELGFNGGDLKLQGEAMDALEVEITFLKHFLVFAIQTGVEQEPLRNVLVHTRPFVINAVRVFIKEDTPDSGYTEWIGNVQSKCSTAAAADPQVYQAYTQALRTSLLSSTGSKYGPALHMDDDIFDALMNFLDSLISVFWNMLRLLDSRKDQVRVLYEILRFSRKFLKQRPISFGQIGVVICDAAVMFFSSIHQTNVDMANLGLSDLLQRFDVIQSGFQANPSQKSEIISPKPKELHFYDSASEKDLQLQKEASSSSQQSLHSTPQVVGFQEDEVTLVVDRLTRGSKELRIVPIIGMAGLGKTTFALELYNHLSIRYHFHAQAWCPISQVLDKRRVFLQLLNQTKPRCNTSDMTEDDLGDELRKSLKGNIYLIFLDDVWTPDVWNNLREAFPDDYNGSRVILTSRHHDIAPCGLIADGEPHLLRPREVDECLEILKAKLFPEKSWPPELNGIGLKFAEKCKGLPLTAVVLAGLLATTEQKGWKKILDSLSSGGLSREEQCNSALELSFEHLPGDLKLCFLYFGAFPEDEEVTVKRLIWLWMAEGFVRKKSESRRIEDVAQEYMNKLIERSLVTVGKIRSIGGVKTCRIHDLLHEFCKMKAKQGNFLHLLLQSLDQLSDFNEPYNLQRLSIHSDPLHFQNSRLFCPGAHSLLFFSTEQSIGGDYHTFHITYIIQIFKLLKVLDMGHIVLATELPGEIELLTRLTYLSIQSSLVVIPSSIGNLSNLETFIADFSLIGNISFPHSLWNLQKLKHLHIRWREVGFNLPNENLENTPLLLELETLSGVVFYADGNIERQMRKFPNIRRLSCCIHPGVEGMEDLNKIVVVPDFLSQLESLTIKGQGRLQCGIGSTENIRKINLDGFELSREGIAVIGGFPNLEVLKLEKISYPEGVLEMEEGEFSKLRYLELHEKSFTHLKSWIASDEQLPKLQKLVLVLCTQLEELPSCLETIPTLEEIELCLCSRTLEILVRGIVEAQLEWGNPIKAHITR